MTTAEIEGTEIVIRIPIRALPIACRTAWDEEYGCEQHALYVVDAEEFSKALVAELNDEGYSRGGNTLVTDMLDTAVIQATENGAFGIDDRNNPN